MRRLLLATVLAVAGLALLTAPALASARTFYVHPSGSDDTANIQAAFNAAVKAGPGSTVQLAAGHFYTNNILVKGFHGTFKGAGEHKTVIDCLRGLNPNLPGATVMPKIAYFPFLVAFDGGHVDVSAMSFDITAFSPAETWTNQGNPADYLESTVLVTGNASSAFSRVGFTAGAGNDLGLFNSDVGLGIQGIGPYDPTTDADLTFVPIRGVESVCGCSFNGQDGVVVIGLRHGSLTVTGNVVNAFEVACLIADSSASQIEVAHNRLQSSAGDGVLLFQGWEALPGGGAGLPPLPAPYNFIRDNTIVASNLTSGGSIVTGAGAVAVADESLFYNAPNRLWADIAYNTIRLDNGGYDGGIDGFYARGIHVLHNRISGTGVAGIDVGTGFLASYGFPVGPASGWRILGNDVSGVTAVNSYGGPAAPIWLGPDADHCLVVGGCRPTTVLDQGTDDTLINVTRVTAPAAARSIRANMASKVGLARRLR